MDVTGRTKWSDLQPFWAVLSDGSQEALKEQALRRHNIADGFYSLTIEEFIGITGGDLKMFNIKDDGTAYEQIFINELKEFLSKYVETLSSYNIEQTADERRASSSCVEVSMAEGLLIFARQYFNLPSFTKAGELTLADLMIAKKDAYNTAVFQRAMNKIQTSKYKK